jgi:hypothetical protein
LNGFIIRSGENRANVAASGAPGLVKQLEVEPRDGLNQSSALILSVRRIGASQEVDGVDVIEGVQELARQLEIGLLDDV